MENTTILDVVWGQLTDKNIKVRSDVRLHECKYNKQDNEVIVNFNLPNDTIYHFMKNVLMELNN